LRSFLEFEDTMLQIPRPTPTCTRFQTTIEMPCIKCGERMRLASIEPQGHNFDLVTYRCIPCVCEESFLQPV
jgi:hypothetical protein